MFLFPSVWSSPILPVGRQEAQIRTCRPVAARPAKAASRRAHRGTTGTDRPSPSTLRGGSPGNPAARWRSPSTRPPPAAARRPATPLPAGRPPPRAETSGRTTADRRQAAAGTPGAAAAPRTPPRRKTGAPARPGPGPPAVRAARERREGRPRRRGPTTGCPGPARSPPPLPPHVTGRRHVPRRHYGPGRRGPRVVTGQRHADRGRVAPLPPRHRPGQRRGDTSGKDQHPGPTKVTAPYGTG